jgi:Ca2+/Na+ antiporter
MGDLLKAFAGFFSGGAGAAVGSLATLAAVVAALTPLVAMVFKERNEVLTVVTVGDAAFYGVGFAIMLTVAWLTRRTRAVGRRLPARAASP